MFTQKQNIILVVLFIVILMTGCSQHVVQGYKADTSNRHIYKILKENNITIKLALSSDGGKNQHTTFCRLTGRLKTHTGEPYHVYIRRNLQEELINAGIYSENSNNTITIYLNDIYASSDFNNAYWKYNVTLKSSNEKSIVVETIYPYPSSFSGSAACKSMQQNFVYGVERLIKDIVNNKQFNILFAEKIVAVSKKDKVILNSNQDKERGRNQYFMMVDSKIVNNKSDVVLVENAIKRHFHKYFLKIKQYEDVASVNQNGILINIKILDRYKFPKRGMKISYELSDIQSKEIISRTTLERSTLFGGFSKVARALAMDIRKDITRKQNIW